MDIRKIKFRGKDVETGEWIYGNLIQRLGRFPNIMFQYECCGKIHYAEHPVKRETIGQFTGLFDKNREEIYEGDVLQVNPTPHGRAYVRWHDKEAHFVAQMIGCEQWYSINAREVEICGNIYDTPELLNEK